MLNTLIIGASGYTGVELVLILSRHPYINIVGLVVSEKSPNIGKSLSEVHPRTKNIIDLPLQDIKNLLINKNKIDVVFLATSHDISHELAPKLLKNGCIVFDLSGAFRVKNKNFYKNFYGFQHKNEEWLNKAVYGLAEFQVKEIKKAQLIAVPGCYPTVSQLALKPLLDANLIDRTQYPVINAVSGVSGTGRKASIQSHFCEISLEPYGVFNHRHHLEIVEHLGIEVIFIPHIGSFSRGILATIVCLIKTGIDSETISSVFNDTYCDKPLIRLYKKGFPSLKYVVGLPYCDIGFALKNEHLIVIAAEDNLLKGAASQAVQCMNIHFDFPETLSIL
ncbi:N-acetyl-gamma-glutamyl-phosphate reductase [Candidatus Pantoea edessiphila]|uniref:N-acetyl-gamma-glutamyl-phosphate reductase n=1 Tax=Candidatus Pantoea edessiphila TaxID=2044610 RepID=A0A2P5SZ43_9GAMM|nr:N-acetyl-gamma-glutamyl-phosphate reductase [Candidatus Pantoea edessiphila]MBK4775266.1 N-acetyl-gamma-glutamyl-phosphate reductase [Pantoea sp. Edef]PPI87595.1 N-acetyl-gamma-glutamyl-phosphate reductase [Candidatus Pantoea edessiphila]